MTTFTRKFALSAAAVLSLVVASTAVAGQPKALLLPPSHDHCYSLPKFGFSSFNIHGFGEQITKVRWNSRAARMGLEPGDVIVSLNGYPLRYHGAWNDALRQAVQEGGWVRLVIRDVRTGNFAHRQTFIGHGGVGPVTPHVVAYNQYPTGPITTKKATKPIGNQPKFKIGTPEQMKQIADLFDKD